MYTQVHEEAHILQYIYLEFNIVLNQRKQLNSTKSNQAEYSLQN